ncbi:MAG TPA: hypothetical protein VGL53_07615 [Bryobacteraceae bacterium]|jgi:hypothetical protein
MRLHLFEFNDQPWLPSAVRNALTAYLYVAYRSTPFGRMFAQRVAALLSLTGSNNIVDLCSGYGGPVAIVKQELSKSGIDAHITMTDLFPHKGIDSGIEYWPEPVDARAVPKRFTGTRTMFASFHHFRPADAAQILRSAFESRCPIGVFEVTARTWIGIPGAILIPFGVLLMTPRIRPVTALQIVFTYLIPILPLMIFWDGLVSQLRTYTPKELRKMTADLSAPNYEWDIGTMRVPGTPLSVPYLTGRPL